MKADKKYPAFFAFKDLIFTELYSQTPGGAAAKKIGGDTNVMMTTVLKFVIFEYPSTVRFDEFLSGLQNMAFQSRIGPTGTQTFVG